MTMQGSDDGGGPDRTRARTVPGPDAARGVYGISVAAELVGMGVQTLRLYERRGLLEPARTDGGTRRYSERDLDRLRRISELLGAGLNLAGIALVLDLELANARLLADRDAQGWLRTARIGALNPGIRRSGRRRSPAGEPANGPAAGSATSTPG